MYRSSPVGGLGVRREPPHSTAEDSQCILTTYPDRFNQVLVPFVRKPLPTGLCYMVTTLAVVKSKMTRVTLCRMALFVTPETCCLSWSYAVLPTIAPRSFRSCLACRCRFLRPCLRGGCLRP